MPTPILTTSKMPKETEQQYAAWLLYCEAGSIPKLMRAWDQLRQGDGDATGIFGGKVRQLGPLPIERNVEKWCSQYRWVERKDLKLTEDLVGIRKKSQEITQKKLGIIGELMWEKLQSIKRQMKKGEIATVDEAKKLWEMFRTEMGETLGKHEFNIREEDQKPPTEEEMADIEDISQAFKTFYEQQRRRPGKETGNLLGNKKQDKK